MKPRGRIPPLTEPQNVRRRVCTLCRNHNNTLYQLKEDHPKVGLVKGQWVCMQAARCEANIQRQIAAAQAALLDRPPILTETEGANEPVLEPSE